MQVAGVERGEKVPKTLGMHGRGFSNIVGR